ncbi:MULTISPECIES: MFS transporter [unclassified Porphyromonas]|uniref:MFS transporter n=1 Tax=unclassified Porphyromonas TaxID=2645799 RepID=UPI00052B7F00|nr:MULTISPECIES: MFS transporter [unclassified Porphyromonas]KGN84985.1 glucose transporter [Porphyromonas sp. COT-290 OH860]KGN97819.1 glucose transporter [Porphyromonas sp. COT-290 OH3588]
MNQVKQQQSYLMPFIIMVVLMSLIGLITNLNQQFQGPMQAAYLIKGGSMTTTLTNMLNFSFFLAYLVMGPFTNRYIDKNGYKKSLVFGLFILIAAFGLYELSAYVFETFDKPHFEGVIAEAKAAGDAFVYTGAVEVPKAYYVFLVAAFVAGTALTYLQAVVNPYLVACDVKGTSAVQRQSIAGAGNSLMTTIGPLFVAYVIFQQKSGLDINITSLYVPILALIALVALIIVALGKIHLPSIASAEKKEGEVLEKSVWSFSHLALGVVAIFMYVGVEVAVGANITLYAKDSGFDVSTAATMTSLYWGGLLVGRLLGSFLSKISANTQLVVTSAAAGILVAAGMVTNNPWIMVGAGLFHSIMWPAIFSLAIDKLGKYTSAGTGALMMGVVGGAVLPLVQAVAVDFIGGWQWTWAIVVVGEIYLLYYALVGYKVKQLP